MSKETNLATQKKLGEAVSTGQLENLNDVFSPNVVDHDPAPGQKKGPEGYIEFFKQMRDAFPDLQLAVDHMVTDDDNVAIAYTAKGTQKGNFMGIEPTGKSVKFRGLQIARFEDGKIVERWGSSDELGILKQIGAVK